MRSSRVLVSSLELLAVLCTSVFAGAALYISLVEHPARMSLETAMAALHWAPSYRRATLMQAPLALIGCGAALAAWAVSAARTWLLAALLIGAVVPFTLLVIRPTNERLLRPGRDLSSPETRALLRRWGLLHALRSALSLLATLLMLRQVI